MYVSDLIKAIDYAIEKEVAVINMSLGGSKFSVLENEAIQRAIQAGVVVVASAGNTRKRKLYELPSFIRSCHFRRSCQ